MNETNTEIENSSSPLESLKGLKGIEYRKAWNKLHPEKCRQAGKKWRQKNPDKQKPMSEDTKMFLRKYYRESGKRKINRDRHKPVYRAGWQEATMRKEPWGEVDDCKVMERKMSDRELSRQIGRSINAIQIRRARLVKQNTEEGV